MHLWCLIVYNVYRKIQRSVWRDGGHRFRRSPRISALDAWKYSEEEEEEDHHHHQRPPSGAKRKLYEHVCTRFSLIQNPKQVYKTSVFHILIDSFFLYVATNFISSHQLDFLPNLLWVALVLVLIALTGSTILCLSFNLRETDMSHYFFKILNGFQSDLYGRKICSHLNMKWSIASKPSTCCLSTASFNIPIWMVCRVQSTKITKVFQPTAVSHSALKKIYHRGF